MSSRASAATSTTLPMFDPSFVRTASPVLRAVHAICSSAMRLLIEALHLRGLDRGGLAEDQQEQRLACEPLRVAFDGDGSATSGHDERCRGMHGQFGGTGSGNRCVLR